MIQRLAIFDCDGTLVDSQANICMAMEHAFSKSGLTPPPRNIIRRIVGLSVFEAVRALMPDDDQDRHRAVAEQYKSAFHELRHQGLVEEPLYDGMAALLGNLRAAGWHLAVATGKSDRGLRLCLEHHGLADHFISLQTADRHPSKPHPSMIHQALIDAGVEAEHAFMIGDTSYDIHMGKAAAVRAIGVSWGYHTADELYAAGADNVVNTMAELQDSLQ